MKFSLKVLGCVVGVCLSTSAGAHEMSMTVAADRPVTETLEASNCWIRMLPVPAPSGGFLVVRNTGDQSAVLDGVSSPAYGHAMMHQTTESDGMSRMAMVKTVEIPAGQTLEFKPGSYHLMLSKPKAGLKIGESVAVDFSLADGQRLQTQCVLRSPKAMSASGVHGAHGASSH